MTLPGALLSSVSEGVVNITGAGALTIQYLADSVSVLPHSPLAHRQSHDVVGLDPIVRMSFVLVPAWIALLAFSRQLNLLAIDENTAVTLGVNVRRCESIVYALRSLDHRRLQSPSAGPSASSV